MKINYKNITFVNTLTQNLDYRRPFPASKEIPDWYRKTPSYIGDNEKKPTGDGNTSGTIKKCIPVFDAITSGYIIPTPVDVYVSKKDGDLWYEWPSMSPISFHPVEQAPLHPLKTNYSYPKWMNPWAIKTPKGYSCLFIQPVHRESVFTILTGIVDTDSYSAPVNFPFVLNDKDFVGIIPAGTPMVQVIPFKRDSWKQSFGDDTDKAESNEISQQLRTVFFDSYKKLWWNKKEYK